jgi:hypothetical protein
MSSFKTDEQAKQEISKEQMATCHLLHALLML